MNKRFRRGTNNIAQYRVLRPNRTSPEMIMVLLNGDKTNVQTTTSHRHGAGERSSLYLALVTKVADRARFHAESRPCEQHGRAEAGKKC
jgi:hypothetical protein